MDWTCYIAGLNQTHPRIQPAPEPRTFSNNSEVSKKGAMTLTANLDNSQVNLHWHRLLSGPEVKWDLTTTIKASTTFGQEASTHCPPRWLFAAQYSRQQKFRHCSINHVSPDYCDPIWDVKSLRSFFGRRIFCITWRIQIYTAENVDKYHIHILHITASCTSIHFAIKQLPLLANAQTLIPAPGPLTGSSLAESLTKHNISSRYFMRTSMLVSSPCTLYVA